MHAKQEPWDKSAADTIRNLIRDENTWINNRIMWLSSFEGFLFTGLGFAWGKPANHWLLIIFCCLGALFALFSLIGLDAAGKAIRKQTEDWEDHKPGDYRGPDVVGLPAPKVKDFLKGVGPWTAFPTLILVAWVVIGIMVCWQPSP